MEDRLLATVRMLADYPRLGRVIDATHSRQLTVARTKYNLIYRVTSRRIRLLRLLHGARRWPAGD